MKRREKKKVELREGHLVLDLPVARSLAQLGNQAGGIEGESGKLRCESLIVKRGIGKLIIAMDEI